MNRNDWQSHNNALGIYFKRVDTIPRHPAQLYEAIAYFIIFLLLFITYKTKNITIGNGFTLA
jgi:prolipoprotein diacylglyceryltransferase